MEVYYPAFYTSYAPTEERSPSRHRKALKTVLGAPYRLRYGDQDRTPAAAPDRHRLLDIGSGAGAYAARMAAAAWEVSIVEPNRQLAAATKVNLGLPEGRVCDAPAEEASFPEESFDLVTMSHVVEHLTDPIAVLQKVRTWLRPGGHLRVWVPNAASWEAKVFRRSWHGLDVPRHVSHFEPSTLRHLLETCGFSVERVVPELQTGSLASSVLHLARGAGARLGHRSPYRRSSFAYYFTLVPGSILVALGNAAYMDVTASRR